MKESKLKIILIALIITIALLSIGAVVLYFTTDMFKTNETLFKKYISQGVENISEVFDISKENELKGLLQDNDYTENTDIYLKYLETQDDEEETYNIKEQGIINNVEQQSYRKIEASYNEEKLSTIELLKQQNTYALRLSNLVQQFVSIENTNLSYFLSSLGYDGQEIPESINKVDLNGIFDFSEEEKNALNNTYNNAIFAEIDNSFYQSQRNSIITLNNGQSVNTNAYMLTLNKNTLDKIFKRVLTQAINDQIILSRIDKIQEKLQEAGYIDQENQNLRETYVSTLQSISDSIEYEGEDARKIIFTVYESNKVMVRASIKTEETEYLIDMDNTNGNNISIKIIQLTDEGTDEHTFYIGKSNTDVGFTRTIGYNGVEQNLTLTLNSIKQDNAYSIGTNIEYSNQNIEKISVEANTVIQNSSNNSIPVSLNEKNNIKLNDYEGDRVLSIIDELKNRFIRSLENSQSKINTKLLNNILIWINEKQEEQANKEQNDIEFQKQRFNNRFILYAGENLKYEHVQKLIKVISQNMSDYQVISGTKIKVYIEDGKENQEKANEIAEALSEEYTYNVEINYSEDGYVDSIDISVYRE